MIASVPAQPPIQITPWLDPKPWGGQRLAAWGIALPADEIIGEAHLAAPEATVTSGELAGLPLRELARRDPQSWVGARGLAVTGGQAIFPLLVKLIAGESNLSIQVHPDDAAAAESGLGTGKTEAYHILAADPGSVLYLGLDPEANPAEFVAACRRADGSAARLLRQIPVEAGMTVLIPARTPHAPGARITLYEIQQPSNVTFRLDDWGRRDASGAPRALHHAEGFAVLDPASRPEPIPRLRLPGWPLGRALLVATSYFALERLEFSASEVFPLVACQSPRVLTSLAGVCHLSAAGTTMALGPGVTAVVPAASAAILTGSAAAIVLSGWVPDLEREIIAPARAAGVSDDALRRLGADQILSERS